MFAGYLGPPLLVGRLPSEELMAQIPSFLPALFDAFGNHSADVRKMVVSFPVDIYIVLGKALLPYLGSLSSTQLRLVTIHANRISQARSGVVVDMQNVEAMTGHINCVSQTRQSLRASSLTVANGEVYNRPKTWNKIHGYLDTPPQMISMAWFHLHLAEFWYLLRKLDMSRPNIYRWTDEIQ
ncbi:hypothetical protein SUGI_0050780 [Cryptomeria japonica]|nr:hypothetical protein SUGI_0050780 [Cryptomeria japonica]